MTAQALAFMLSSALSSVGVDAHVAERRPVWGDRPPDWSTSWTAGRGYQVGLLEINYSPIRWANIIERSFSTPYAPSSSYTFNFIAPDGRVGDMEYIYARSKRHKSIPLVGGISSIDWISCGLHQDLIKKFIDDVSINRGLAMLKNDVNVSNCPEHRCWIISPRIWSNSGEWKISTNDTAKWWSCIESIVRYLLNEPFEKKIHTWGINTCGENNQLNEETGARYEIWRKAREGKK